MYLYPVHIYFTNRFLISISMPLTKNEKKKYNARNQKKNQLKRRGKQPDSDSEEENIIMEMESGEDDEEDVYETCSDEDEDDEEEEDEDEDSDSTYVPPKKSRRNQRKKRIETSDDEDDEDEEEDENGEDAEEEDDETSAVDPRELRKTIAALFPSNYINKKVKADSKMKSLEKKSANKSNTNRKDKKSKRKPSDTDDDDDDSDDDEDYDDDDEEYDDAANKFSIFFTALNGGDPEDENAICDDVDAKDDCDSDDEKTFMKETYETILLPSTLQNTIEKTNTKKTDKKKSTKSNSKPSKKDKSSKKSKDAEEDTETDVEDPNQPSTVETEYNELVELKKHLLDKLAMKPKSKILLNAIEECRKSIQKLVKKARMKNTKKYYKLVNKDEKPTSEIDYFKKKLSHKEQVRAMKELKEINDRIHIEKPYRLTLLDSNIPAKYKATVMQKLNILRSMEPGDPEYYKLKSWVDTFMRVPFNVNKSLSISLSDGVDKCSEFMENAMNTLDTCVYGLRDAKMQIMQMLGQWITNPDAMGSAIAIKGPPGTGKTSLVKEGISKILGREFTFIALGGTGDASFLEGHSYTYEGSMWGKIVQILIDSKCMNPVIYFDELDKVSDTPRGEEIIGILTHLTDTTQNNQFHDKYFSEIDFDLSKCLFIFSYNDESKVNPILRDRMYRIETKGYDAKEKGIIARNYLLPKIREQVSFTENDIIIPDETLQTIISNRGMTKDEDGVRNLKRCLEIIHTKLNLFRLMKPEKNLFVKDIDVQVSFPFTVRPKDAELLIKSEQHQNQSLLAMYV
jgi:ATP-dependent Lon protease